MAGADIAAPQPQLDVATGADAQPQEGAETCAEQPQLGAGAEQPQLRAGAAQTGAGAEQPQLRAGAAQTGAGAGQHVGAGAQHDGAPPHRFAFIE